MFNIGWTELVVIGVVALIVIGPRDLPEMFRTLGRVTAKLRSMSREFQRAMETAATESGVKDVARDLKSATSAKNLGLDAVKDAASRFEKWDPLKPMAKPAPAAAAAKDDAKAVAAMGPETQALADKVAAKNAIAKDAAEKMKAVAVSAPPKVQQPADKPAGKVPAKAKVAAAKAKPAAAQTIEKPKPAAADPARTRGGRVRVKAQEETGEA